MKQNIALFGATGSIGASALDVIARHPDQFCVYALSAHRNINDLIKLSIQFQPRYAIAADADFYSELQHGLKTAGLRTEAMAGAQALDDIAMHQDVDTVLAAIVGAAGLSSTLAAARAGKRLLLANKEAIVMSGEILLATLRQSGGLLLPIDSEHNAILQCLPRDYRGNAELHGIERIILTASGGPFRGRSRESLKSITPEQAIAHPNWRMGRKISVDSATLANKGLEVIEARWLFELSPEQIDVLVHPQSLVHALVQYRDGSTLAQLGLPDMRTAIACALAWPNRIEAGVKQLNLHEFSALQFEPPDRDVFRALPLALQSLQAGGTAPTIFNAANEVAVEAFLQTRLAFLNIAQIIEQVLNTLESHSADTLQTILEADQRARQCATKLIMQAHNQVSYV